MDYLFNKQGPRMDREVNCAASFDSSPFRKTNALDNNLVRSVTNSASNISYQRRDDRFHLGLPKTQRAANTVLNQAADLHLDRVVLYKRGHYINEVNYFVIEISVT